MRSFTAGDTEFELEKSDTPVTVDGFAKGEPTGEVSCRYCEASHTNIDEIPHDEDCPQRFVHSRWYAETMTNDD